MDFKLSPVEVGLRVDSTTTSVLTDKDTRTDVMESSRSRSNTWNSEDTATLKKVFSQSLKVGLDLDITKPITEQYSAETSSSEDRQLVTKSVTDRSEVARYNASTTRVLEAVKTATTEIKPDSGYMSAQLTVENQSGASLLLKNITIGFYAYDPLSPAHDQLFSSVVLSGVSRSSGTVPGARTTPADNMGLLELSLAGHTKVDHLVLSEGITRTAVENLLRSGKAVRARVISYQVLSGTKPLDRDQELSNTLARAAEITITRPDSPAVTVFPIVDGHVSVLDVLKGLGMNPTYRPEAGIVSLLGVASEKSFPTTLARLYETPGSRGWWIFSSSSNTRLDAPLTPMTHVHIAFVTSRDLIEENPPQLAYKSTLSLDCGEAARQSRLELAIVDEGSVVDATIRLWGSSFQQTLAQGFLPPDPNPVQKGAYDPFFDGRFVNYFQPSSKIMDTAEVSLSGLGSKFFDFALEGPGSRPIPLDSLQQSGLVRAVPSIDGSVRLSVIAEKELLSTGPFESLLATGQKHALVFVMGQKPLKVRLGRSLSPQGGPAGVPARTAYEWIVATRFWISQWTEQDYQIFAGLRGEVDVVVTYPVKWDKDSDTVILGGIPGSQIGRFDERRYSGESPPEPYPSSKGLGSGVMLDNGVLKNSSVCVKSH